MNTKNFPYNVDGVDKVITNFNPRAIRRLPFGEKVYIKYDNKLAAAIPIAVGIGSKTTEDSRYKLTRHGILFRVAGVEYGQVYWDEDMKMYQSPEDYVNGNPLPIEREEWIADRINAFFVSNESDFRVYVNECNACIRGWVYNSILDRAEQGKMAFMLWFDKNGIHFETDYKTENGALLFPSAEEALSYGRAQMVEVVDFDDEEREIKRTEATFTISVRATSQEEANKKIAEMLK